MLGQGGVRGGSGGMKTKNVRLGNVHTIPENANLEMHRERKQKPPESKRPEC